jgi:hypothetical protein
MGVVILYSAGGADVAEDVVVGTVEFEKEDVERKLSYNWKAPIPAATTTAPAPAYFRKRRLEGLRGNLLDSAKALNSSLQYELATMILVVSPTFRDFGNIKHIQNISKATSRQATVFLPAFPPRLGRLRISRRFLELLHNHSHCCFSTLARLTLVGGSFAIPFVI